MRRSGKSFFCPKQDNTEFACCEKWLFKVPGTEKAVVFDSIGVAKNACQTLFLRELLKKRHITIKSVNFSLYAIDKFSPYSPFNGAVLAIYLRDDSLDKLDTTWGNFDICLLPWNYDGENWKRRNGAIDICTGKAITPQVVPANVILDKIRNQSIAPDLHHFADCERILEKLKEYHRAKQLPDSHTIKEYFIHIKWSSEDAERIASAAEKIRNGQNIRSL